MAEHWYGTSTDLCKAVIVRLYVCSYFQLFFMQKHSQKFPIWVEKLLFYAIFSSLQISWDDGLIPVWRLADWQTKTSPHFPHFFDFWFMAKMCYKVPKMSVKLMKNNDFWVWNQECQNAPTHTRPEPTAAHRYSVGIITPFLIFRIDKLTILHRWKAFRWDRYHFVNKGRCA